MANQTLKPGNSEIENLRYLARYLAAEDRLLDCQALLALVTPGNMAVKPAQVARLLKEALTAVARQDADRGVRLAQEALESGEILPQSERFPCAAAGELLGLLDPKLSIGVALARQFPQHIIDSLTRKDEPDSKRERQARASVWMAAIDVKRYTGESERKLLAVLLGALRDEVKSKEFRQQAAAALADTAEDESAWPTPQLPATPTVPPASEPDSSPGWMRWVWRAAIPSVLVVAVAVGIGVYKARSSESYSIQVETDLNRVSTTGIPVGAYLFDPGALVSAAEKPTCGNGYGIQEWAQDHGGVPVGLQYVRVSITAQDEPILVNFAEVEAVHSANRPGDVANCLDGTQLEVRFLDVDTDQETTVYYSEVDPQKGQLPEPLALHIAPGESEVIIVSAKAATKDASWRLKLGMDIGGERIEHVVRDTNGQDFQLAASEGAGRTTYTEAAPHQWEVLDW